MVPNYRFAVTNWWDGSSMYPGGTHGFLYAPPFSILFSPFELLRPKILGEILWRAFGFGLFAFSLRSLSTFHFPPSTFLPLVLLSIPASLASLNNGQTNLPLSASLVLAALSLRRQKWNCAAFFLTLSLILKPIALAPWLLAFVVLPAMRTPLLIGLPAFMLIGLLHPHPSYALSQWSEFFQKLMGSYTPENLRVSDIFGTIDRMGIQIPPMLEKATRAGACLGFLVWVWQSYCRHGVAKASWALWVGTALVFTVLNPRAETNGYVLISPLLAYAAISYWQGGEGSRWKGAVLAGASIGLMCDGMGLLIYKATDVWFKPLIVLLVSPLLFRMPDGWKVESGRREDR